MSTASTTAATPAQRRNMTPSQSAATWLLATIAALLMASAGLWLDGPDDVQTAAHMADDAADARAAAAQAARFRAAAHRACGENADWRELQDGAVQCRTRRGHNTFIAQVKP